MAVTFACFAVAIGSSIVVMDMDVVAEDLNTSLDVIHCKSEEALWNFSAFRPPMTDLPFISFNQ